MQTFDFLARPSYDNRLMSTMTPGYIDPFKMAKNRQVLQGEIAVADLLRAKKLLAAETGDVKYELRFGIDEDGVCVLNGALSANITMCCQRCLREFSTEVRSDFLVSPVNDDAAAKALPESYEPVFVEDNRIYPEELVEDELILALPIVPMHIVDNEHCKETVSVIKGEQQDLGNPFKVLQELNISVNKKGP